ncbi:MAG: hypothetical protein AAFY88_32390, partial [Acidobacteriota bacterium]
MTSRLFRTFLLCLLAVASTVDIGWAQDPQDADAAAASPPAGATPSGSARLLVGGAQAATIGFSLRSDGPRFAVGPIAQALGIELRVGPLGDAHTLFFEGKQVLFGPDDPNVVTVSPDGSTRQEIWRLSASPSESASGLQVPLEFLTRTFGEELG